MSEPDQLDPGQLATTCHSPTVNRGVVRRDVVTAVGVLRERTADPWTLSKPADEGPSIPFAARACV